MVDAYSWRSQLQIVGGLREWLMLMDMIFKKLQSQFP